MDFLAQKVQQTLGLDDESTQQIVQNAESMNGGELRSFLIGFLGDEKIVEEYLNLRQLERASAAQPAAPTPPPPQPQQEQVRGPQEIQGNSMNFVSNGVWDSNESKRKKAGLKEKKTTTTKKNSNQLKVDSLGEIDSALKFLEISENKRSKCDCMAQRHPLLDIAPNCLNCGKIVCVKEGLGRCTSCGKELISSEDLSNINQILQSEREQISSTMGKKARQRAEYETGTSLSNKLQSEHSEAEARLNKLLEFQNTSAQRTKIIDQVSDFEMPGYGSTNQWASPMEQVQQLKRQQRQMKKLEQARLSRQGRGKKVISIDIKGNKVYSKEEDAELSDSEEEEEEKEKEPVPEEPKQKFVTWNPSNYGQNFIKPVADKNKNKGKQQQIDDRYKVNNKSSIVQFDDDESRILEL